MIHQETLGRPLQLARVTLAEQSRFQAAFNRLKQPISDYTFANVFVWGTSLDLYWCALHRHVCIFANGTGDLTMLLPPLAEAGATLQDLSACLVDAFSLMDEYNIRAGRPEASRIEYVSDEMLEQIRAASSERLNLSATPVSGDFVYPCSRMIDLAGGDLKSKRHGRSKFIREFPDFTTAVLGDRHIDQCIEMVNQWRSHGDQLHPQQVTEDDTHIQTSLLREKESAACRLALEQYRTLGLTGLVVYVGDRLAGFTLGERMSPAQASILFEKTDPQFHGCPQLIFSEFCRQCWSDMPEINAGDDWGIPTLRFTKESYRPTRRLAKYLLTRTAVAHAAKISSQWLEAQNTARPESDEISIRDADTRDLPRLLAVEHCAFNLDDAFTWRQIRRLIINPRVLCRVIEAPGSDAVGTPRIVGWAAGLVRQHSKHRSGRLYNLAIDPLAQGAGLGRRLAMSIIDELEAAGCLRIYLEVRKENARAISLYSKLGFEVVSALPDYYGDGIDGLSMRRTAEVKQA